MKHIRNKVKTQFSTHIWDQVFDQVYNQIWIPDYQVYNQDPEVTA